MAAAAEPTYAALAAENAQLRAENAALKRQLARCQESGRKEKAANRWRKGLDANVGLSTTQRVVAAAALDAYKRVAERGGAPMPTGQEDAEPTLLPVWFPDIAEKAAVSESTVGLALQATAAAGAFHREVRIIENETTGERVKRTFIAPTRAFLLDPKAPAVPDKPKHGGDRRACPHCGSDNLVERRQIVCKGCGAELHSEERDVNPPLEPVAPDVTAPGPLPQVAAIETPAPELEPEPQPEPEPAPELELEPAPAVVPIRQPLYFHGDDPPDVPCEGCGRRVYAHVRNTSDAWACRICWPALTL